MNVNDEDFLFNDLKNNGIQSSWDWVADSRFSEHLGDEDNLINKALHSAAPTSIKISASRTWKHITQKRLRVLRKLVKKGKCRAYWSGTGLCGFIDYGVKRLRNYEAL